MGVYLPDIMVTLYVCIPIPDIMFTYYAYTRYNGHLICVYTYIPDIMVTLYVCIYLYQI